MRHYICIGTCDGQAAVPGVCKGEGCNREGEALVPCDCTDSLHAEVKERGMRDHEDEDA